ncbi:hypothetical protein CR513_20811, partial [Mucuna pruriens]
MTHLNVTSYNGIIVNSYKFHTKERNIYGENDLDYYGIIEEILELSYLGSQKKVFLLQCQWFDLINGVNVDERFELVDVNRKSKLHSYEPFILAPQAQQVYYTMYPQKRDRVKGKWWATCKLDANDYYQDDVSLGAQNVIPKYEVVFVLDTNAPIEEVCINDIYKPMEISFGRETRRGRGRGSNPPQLDYSCTSPPPPHAFLSQGVKNDRNKGMKQGLVKEHKTLKN